jgi:TatD DNase family protein
MEKQIPDTEALLAEFFSADDAIGLDVDTGLDAKGGDAPWQRRLTYARRHRGLYLTVGYGPEWTERGDWRAEVDAMGQRLSAEDVVAVGEIGLDRYRAYGTPSKQRELFAAQLAMAARQGLPVVIHNREADGDILKLYGELSHRRGGVLHCFTSDGSFAKKALDVGLHISFAGNLTFKGSVELREIAGWIPQDRLLVETDAPYLSPHPVRGRPNSPTRIIHTFRLLAKLRSAPLPDLIRSVAENFRSLFL